MAELAEAAAEAEAPIVMCIGSDQFRRSVGAVWHQVAAGATIRVSDLRSGEVLGYVTRHPPAELSGHEHLLPPADVSDAPGPDAELVVPEPAWVVRLDGPEPEPARGTDREAEAV
jgi:hypothetical protein